MTTQEILKADLLDIIFSNRNKSYGAYELRKHYGQRLYTSLFGGIGVMVLLLFLLRPGNVNKPPLPPKVVVVAHTLPPIIEPAPPEPKTIAPPAQATASFTPRIKMVDQPLPIHELEPVVDMQLMQIGNVNSEGIPVIHEGGSVGNNNEAVKEPVNEQAETAFIAVESAPQFPGGAAAWMHFLSRYLQVPEELAPGETKKVLVQFVVGRDGSVDAVTVLQSAGAVFDREVLRVLKKMPKWKPALQNGQPVAVTFTQPVTFVGIE